MDTVQCIRTCHIGQIGIFHTMMIILPALSGTVLFENTIQRRSFIYRTGVRNVITIRSYHFTFYHIRKNELSSIILKCSGQPLLGTSSLGIIFLIGYYIILALGVFQDRLFQTSQTIVIVCLILPSNTCFLRIGTCSNIILITGTYIIKVLISLNPESYLTIILTAFRYNIICTCR